MSKTDRQRPDTRHDRGSEYDRQRLQRGVAVVLRDVHLVRSTEQHCESTHRNPSFERQGGSLCLLAGASQIIKRVRPSIYLSSIMTLWGIATIAQGFVKNLRSLIALRLLVGLFEAGLFPGCLFLIASWYKRYELQWRFNLFFSSSILAGGFSGLLAYAIANMAGVGGYNGWSWIFIL